MIENFPRIGRGLNGVATNFNRQIFSWRPEQELLLRSIPQKFINVDLNILTCCLHTPRWMFYFITNGCQNSMFCNIASIPRRNYEKSYRLKQWSLIGPVFGRPCPKPVRLAESMVGTVADRSLQSVSTAGDLRS